MRLYRYLSFSPWSYVDTRSFSAVALASVAFGFSTLANAGVCDYANTTYSHISTGLSVLAVSTGLGLKAAGVISVAHSSGAAIAATTSGGYLAGTIGAGGTAIGVVTAPVTLLAGGIAVVAAGGTIGYCRYTNNRATPVRAVDSLEKASETGRERFSEDLPNLQSKTSA